MYALLNDLLSDKKGGEVFTLFGLWHIFYIVFFVAIAAALVLILNKREKSAQNRVISAFITVAFGLYIADFFLMPLSYGEIDIEKLPFHACTAMCVMCFWSNHNPRLAKYRVYFALLGFVSNFVYLVYPAGVMWHQVHPISYRVIQTLVYHGIMSVYGLLVLVFQNEEKERKGIRVLTVTVGMTLWAMLGNYIYNGSAGEYNHFFNWFFVVRDPFNMLPAQIAPYLMPALNVVVFTAVEMLVLWIVSFTVRGRKER